MIEEALFWGAIFGVVWLLDQVPKRLARRKFERLLHTVWMRLEAPISYRLPGAGDDAWVRRLDEAVAENDELAQHFMRAGDLIQETAGEAAVALRVFLHADQMMFAYLGTTDHGSMVFLDSYTATEEFGTVRVDLLSRTPFAEPPYSHKQYWPSATKLDRLIKAHQIYSRFDEPARLLRVTSLHDVLQLFRDSAARRRAWRANQNPDELLAKDVLALLGDEGFARHGASWMRRLKRMRAKLPAARLHVPPADLR